MSNSPTYIARNGSDLRTGSLPVRSAWQRRWLPVAVVLLFAVLFVVAGPVKAWAVDEGQQTTEDSAVNDEAGFGLNAFVRNNAGTARSVDGADIGYRYPLQDDANLVVLNIPETADAQGTGYVLVHVDADAAEAAGLDLHDTGDTDALRALIEELDRTHSKGGAVLADLAEREWVFTTDDAFVIGPYCFRFSVEKAGGRYTSIVPADLPEGAEPRDQAELLGLDLGGASQWCSNATLVPSADVSTEAAPGVWDNLARFFSSLDYRPFWVSLKTSVLALAITFVLGLFAAWKTMGTSSRLKGVLDSVFTIPMVLPPTVCGFLLMLLFGRATPTGQWLISLGIDLVFTWPAAVISAVVVSFPLMYRTALGAFEGLDRSMLDAARTLGWSERYIFRRLMLPLAWPSIAAGTVLAFARAMGEFGCTLFFAGNYVGVTQTIPIAIYFQWMGGNTDVALFWVIVVILFCFLVVLFINVYTARSQRYRARGITRRSRRRGRAADQASPATDTASADTVRLDQEALRALLAMPADVVDEKQVGAGARGENGRSGGDRPGAGGMGGEA